MCRSQRTLLVATTVYGTLHSLVRPQVPHLLDAGWKVLLVSSAPEGAHTAIEGASYFELPMMRSVSPAEDAVAWMRWRRLLKRTRPDVVLGSTPKAGLLSMTTAKSLGFPRRVFLHRGARWETMSGLARDVVQRLDRITMASATDCLAVSNSLADLVVAEGVTTNRPTVLGAGGSAGIDLDKFRPGQPRTGGPPTIGFVGRIARDKGLGYALGALRTLQQVRPDAILRVIGGWDASDPVARNLRAELEEDSSVELLGSRHDVPQLLRGIDVLVFPSLREGMPNVVLEAAATGVPTVGWDVTGVRDAIRDGATGSVVPLGDGASFGAKTVQWAISPRDDTARECRKWAQQFSQERLARQLIEYLDRPRYLSDDSH